MANAQPFIFRSLTPDGDWVFGQNLSSYATGQQAIALNTQTRLLMFFQDFFASLLFGINWIGLLSSKNPAAQNGIILQTRQMIAGSVGGYKAYGILAINSLNVFEDTRLRRLTLEYTVTTIFSTQFSGSVSIPLNATG